MRRIALLVAAATVLTGAVVAEARPIPSSSGPGHPTAFLGTPGAAQPFAFGEQAPRHPFMAANGKSNIHDDAYQSDAYTWAGPLGRAPKITSTFQAQEGASVTFDTRGRIATVCVGVQRPTLELLDPTPLDELASYPLPRRKPAAIAKTFTSFGGGGYFYLDNQDRAVIPTNKGTIDVVAERGDAFVLAHRYDVSGSVGKGTLIAAMPDWSGRIWFVASNGVIGFVNPATGVARTRALDEGIGNSFAVD